MIEFIVHGKKDTVGVVVVDAEKGQRLSGVNLETDATLDAMAVENIPLGHKIALVGIPSGQEVLKYNVAIGSATQNIAQGQHVHVHNLKSARWQR